MQAITIRSCRSRSVLGGTRLLLPVLSSRSSYSFTTESAERLPPVLPLPSPPPPKVPRPEKGFLARLVDRYSLKSRYSLNRIAEESFQAAFRQANDPRWYGPGRIKGNEFRPRHALLTMHIWFIHKRLIHDEIEKDQALVIQEDLFNILWDDTICRIRRAGVGELYVNKSLLQVQQYTFLHLTHYDHAFTEFLGNPEERLKELRKIVWRHILVRDEDAEHRVDHLNRIAWYIEANYQNIMMHWPDEYYREARVAWVNLPDFSKMKDASGAVMEDQPVNADDVLPEPWLTYISLKGTDFYWNPETNESTWDRPTK